MSIIEADSPTPTNLTDTIVGKLLRHGGSRSDGDHDCLDDPRKCRANMGLFKPHKPSDYPSFLLYVLDEVSWTVPRNV